MPLSRLVVLLERHHVDRPHRLKPLLQRASLFFLGVQSIPFNTCNRGILTQRHGLYSEIIQASHLDVLNVRSQLRRPSSQPCPLLTQSLCLMP